MNLPMRFLALLCALFILHRHAICQERNYSLRIKPMFGNQQLTIGTGNYVTAAQDTVSVTRFRFYISSLRFIFSDGSEFTESDSYHLVDAEDSSTLQLSLKNIPAKEIASLEFCIGVDSLASVSGALGGDLDPVKGMYWAWNSGYINAKLEGEIRSAAPENQFEFHIGGYLPPYQSIRRISLPKISAGTTRELTVVADASAWFRNISLKNTNRVVMPGAEAVKIANDYTNMFRFEN
jgi:hypothetical protein